MPQFIKAIIIGLFLGVCLEGFAAGRQSPPPVPPKPSKAERELYRLADARGVGRKTRVFLEIRYENVNDPQRKARNVLALDVLKVMKNDKQMNDNEDCATVLARVHTARKLLGINPQDRLRVLEEFPQWFDTESFLEILESICYHRPTSLQVENAVRQLNRLISAAGGAEGINFRGHYRHLFSSLLNIPPEDVPAVVSGAIRRFNEAPQDQTQGAEGNMIYIFLGLERQEINWRRTHPHMPHHVPIAPNPASEVHHYADTTVTTGAEASGACATSSKEPTLNDAVLRDVRNRTKSNRMTFEDVKARIIGLIQKHYAPQLEKAIAAFNKGLSESTSEQQDDLAAVFTFMYYQHPEKMILWLEQFIGESMNAYAGPRGVSCVKGIQERYVLGLRGLGDEELDKLFAQAEGPQLAARVFAGSNFGHEKDGPKNARFVAQKLIELGWTAETTPEAAGKMYKKFLEDVLKDNPTLARDPNYEGQPEIYAELVEGDLGRGKDSVLKKALFQASMKPKTSETKRKYAALKARQAVARGEKPKPRIPRGRK